jgi:hypothetical protein
MITADVPKGDGNRDKVALSRHDRTSWASGGRYLMASKPIYLKAMHLPTPDGTLQPPNPHQIYRMGNSGALVSLPGTV